MAKTIYIIHGWAYSIEPWLATVSVLRSKGYDVRQLRVPGLTVESDDVWDIDSYVAWLHGELKEADNPIVLGHSNGGRIALNYLKEYPGSLAGLILLNSAGINIDNRKISVKRRLFRVLSFAFRPLKYIPLVRKVVYRLIGGSDYEGAPENMKQTLHNMLESDKNLDVSDINTPVKLLWGHEDQTTPLAMGKKLAKQLPNSDIKEFDGWRHAPYRTHPYQLAMAIIGAYEELAG